MSPKNLETWIFHEFLDVRSCSDPWQWWCRTTPSLQRSCFMRKVRSWDWSVLSSPAWKATSWRRERTQKNYSCIRLCFGSILSTKKWQVASTDLPWLLWSFKWWDSMVHRLAWELWMTCLVETCWSSSVGAFLKSLEQFHCYATVRGISWRWVNALRMHWWKKMVLTVLQFRMSTKALCWSLSDPGTLCVRLL